MIDRSNYMLASLCSLVLIFSAFVGAARAEEGLYAEPVSADAAFVRYFGEAPAKLALNGEKLPTSDMKPGLYSDFSSEAFAGLQAGAFYTLVLDADGSVLDQIMGTSPKTGKSLLSLINLTDETAVSLKTADGSVDILSDIASSALGEREVNPITVPVRVFGATDYAQQDLALQANAIVTIVALPGGESQVLTDLIQNRR